MTEKETKKTFEQAMKELDKLVAEVESGKVSLEQTIEKYAQGMELIKYCRSILEQAEKKFEVIAKADRSNNTDPDPD